VPWKSGTKAIKRATIDRRHRVSGRPCTGWQCGEKPSRQNNSSTVAGVSDRKIDDGRRQTAGKLTLGQRLYTDTFKKAIFAKFQRNQRKLKTSSSAVDERPFDANCRLKSCPLLLNCTKIAFEKASDRRINLNATQSHRFDGPCP